MSDRVIYARLMAWLREGQDRSILLAAPRLPSQEDVGYTASMVADHQVVIGSAKDPETALTKALDDWANGKTYGTSGLSRG